MQLYKRLLLSYFPSGEGESSFNPASMFLSFIAAKEFFAIVHQRLIENYKLNLFDVGMDIFDAKISLGNEDKKVSQKVLDTYYGYLIAANFNGYTFYNISNTSNALALTAALFLQDVFEENENQLFIDCLYAFYLISFVFAGQIKVFPKTSTQDDFNRFIEVFFSFYELLTTQLGHKISAIQFQNLKKKLIKQLEIFFMMFHYNRRINEYFQISTAKPEDFFTRLCNDTRSASQKFFFARYKTTKHSTSFSPFEEEMIFNVAPGDILLKYLFLGNNPKELTSTLIASMYDKKKIKKMLTQLIKDESKLNDLLEELLNPKQFKEGYFKGIKSFIDTTYKHINQEEEEALDEFQEMLSEIGEGEEIPMQNLKIPQRVKKESKIVEQFLNFYITFTGGLTTDKGDSFYLRCFKPKLIQTIQNEISSKITKSASKNFYQILRQYHNQNLRYYEQTYKNIRKGKDAFMITKENKNSGPKNLFFAFELAKQEATLTVLQELNPKICKLYLKNPTLLKRFQEQFSDKISSMIKKEKAEFVSEFYAPIFEYCKNKDQILAILSNAITNQELARLKDHLYTFDFRLLNSFLQKFYSRNLQKNYDECALLNIIAILKASLLGILLRCYGIKQHTSQKKTPVNIQSFFHLIVLEILGLNAKCGPEIQAIIEELITENEVAIKLFIEFDDNKEFLSLLRDNWEAFTNQQGKKPIHFAMEDVLWIRGVLQHITYYNKRFLIP